MSRIITSDESAHSSVGLRASISISDWADCHFLRYGDFYCRMPKRHITLEKLLHRGAEVGRATKFIRIKDMSCLLKED